ncbi:glycosyltransferase [Holdemania filiformis]|uniref:glycosyltransferase n=1 Tax=Holdemania filiformis TaxID=61171 RepID=UPI0022E6B7BD|nr:glycosyltransferase [Holdemania filiformis]
MENNKLPCYSVLMTVYKNDNPRWVDLALQSMLEQTVIPSEIVLIEDGPVSEEIESVISKYIAFNSVPIRLYKNDVNIGLGATLKKGVELCRFNYIARMDSDDVSEKTRCEKILKLMVENPKISLAGSDVAEFEGDISNIKAYVRLPQNMEDILRFAKKRVPIRHPSIIFKKDDVLEVGNYKPLLRSQEYDLVIRMLIKGKIISNVNEILLYQRIDDNFYKRRGGLKKGITLAKQRYDFYKYGFYNYFEFLLFASINVGMSIMPNGLRAIIYQKLLRKRS